MMIQKKEKKILKIHLVDGAQLLAFAGHSHQVVVHLNRRRSVNNCITTARSSDARPPFFCWSRSSSKGTAPAPAST